MASFSLTLKSLMKSGCALIARNEFHNFGQSFAVAECANSARNFSSNRQSMNVIVLFNVTLIDKSLYSG